MLLQAGSSLHQLYASCSEDERRILQRAADVRYGGDLALFLADAGLLYASCIFAALDNALVAVPKRVRARDTAGQTLDQPQ